MKRLKLQKDLSKKFGAISVASIVLLTGMLSGCSKKSKKSELPESITVSDVESTTSDFNNSEPTTSDFSNSGTNTSEVAGVVGVVGSSSLYKTEKELVDNTKNNIKKVFKNMNDEVVDNSTLIILLETLAKEDENGKISADVMSNFKSNIDSNNMMNDFNTFLDELENDMIESKKLISVSNMLPIDQKNDKKILAIVENITSSIISSTDSKKISEEFDKIYTLFAEEDAIEVNGFKFTIRNLSYAGRAVAEAYARTSAYYARDYITDEAYSIIDKRTNSQNSKAYIKTKLEILNNQIDGKSEIDVISTFNAMYNAFDKLLKNKVTLTTGDQKDFINYLNLEYLNSDKVIKKDKNEVFGGYNNSKITDTINAIDAISEYNFKNQNNIIIYSDLLIDEYSKTSTGKIDALALDFIEYNTIMVRNTIKEDDDFDTVFNNPYFQNIYKYFLKQKVTYKYKDENSKTVEVSLLYQEVSDNINLFCNEMINYTLNKLPKVKYMDDYIKQVDSNIEQSIQHIQNAVSDECEKIDFENSNESKVEKKVL